jgi:hypothetical protein
LCYPIQISKKILLLYSVGTQQTIVVFQLNIIIIIIFSLIFVTDLYCLSNIVRVIKSRRMRWAEHVARMAEGRGVHRVFVGKPEGRRPFGRPRLRLEDNIKMDLQEVGC